MNTQEEMALEKMLKVFATPTEPTKVSWLYQMGLTIVAFTMILLPLIYLALVGVVGWLVWWHLSHDYTLLQQGRGKSTILMLFLYLAPAIAGIIFVLFLLKPFFAKAEKSPIKVELSEAEEPTLFQFVRSICYYIGAPEPKAIQVDSNVNAAAAFRRGAWSLLSNDLVLVIGLPLAAGLSLRQMAGVLAHEFGHFSQSTGMRLCFVIRFVNRWFARVVYQRDQWDDWLEAWARSESWLILLTFKLAQGGVWVGRKLLWGLMYVGHAISCFMSRQMEFDADSYEVKVAGSESFAETCKRLSTLSAAFSLATEDTYRSYGSNILPDNLPKLILWRESKLSPEILEEIEKQISQHKGAWDDTHPSDSERIKAAKDLSCEGVFKEEGSATLLFRNFEGLSERVTQHYFEHELKVNHEKLKFVETHSYTQDRQLADTSVRHLESFYGPNVFAIRRVQPLELGTRAGGETFQENLNLEGESYTEILDRWMDLDRVRQDQWIGLTMMEAGFTLSKPREFGLTESKIESAEEQLGRTCEQLKQVEAKLRQSESALQGRFTSLLQRWRELNMTSLTLEFFEKLCLAQPYLAQMFQDMCTAMEHRNHIDILLANIEKIPDGDKVLSFVEEKASKVGEILERHLELLQSVPHPYVEGHPPIPETFPVLAKHGLAWVNTLQQADTLFEAIRDLLVRVQGDLCGYALEMEGVDSMSDSSMPKDLQTSGAVV